MSFALAKVTKSELMLVGVNDIVAALPDPERLGLIWWSVVEGLIAEYPDQRRVGPLQDVTYDFASTPEDLGRVTLRHDCDDCRSSLVEGQRLLEARPELTLCAVQYRLDFFTAIE